MTDESQSVGIIEFPQCEPQEATVLSVIGINAEAVRIGKNLWFFLHLENCILKYSIHAG